MIKPKILVTGSNGQLGREIHSIESSYPEFEFIFLTKEILPINHNDRLNNCFTSLKPDFCINCAAYTAVDRAETEKEQAFLINGESTGILAAICKHFHTRFIHISTDYVFNGLATIPYKEDDKVDPVNTYGASKLQGEQMALGLNDQSIIIRTSWVYSEFGSNFVKTMIRLMKERESIGVVDDQYGSPTYAADLAKTIMEIIRFDQWNPGIYHYSNEGVITWYEFAQAIKELRHTTCQINPIPTSSFPTPAKRPAYSVFEKEKITKRFNIRIPYWKDSLEQCMAKL